MCGLAGFINFENAKELAFRSNFIQKHRGPDSQAVWTDNFTAFSHQRLSIIDLDSRSDQPFIKDDFVIVYNGEIYNYKELKSKYLSKVKFLTTSDTEVVLEMYRKFNEKALDYFEGMFAFVIYNTSQNKLFAARDHFGIKPFYYYFKKNRFAFSSELKTLSKLVSDSKTINRKALVSSLNYLWIPGNETIFKEFSKLPPAHFIKLDTLTFNFELKQYWKLPAKLDVQTEKKIIDKLSSEFDKTIRKHMISDVPVSSFLSGGLDSSMISVAASKINKFISTYTIGTSTKDKKVENMPNDEKYAKKLADLHSFDHNEIILSSDITKMLPEMVKTLDEPIGDPAALNTFLICKAARDKEVKVLLSGMGADEIFCGYRRQKALLIAQTYKKLPSLLRKIIKKIVDVIPVKIAGFGIRFSRWSKKFISFAEMNEEEAYRTSYSYYEKKELIDLFKFDVSEQAEMIQSY